MNRPFVNLAARRADAIITVSESAKRDIVRLYGLAPGRVHVVHEAAAPVFRVASDNAPRRVPVGGGVPVVLGASGWQVGNIVLPAGELTILPAGDGTVSAGLPLQLAFSVARVNGSACTAFAGALVDVWHCDALGVYSDVSDPGFQTKGKKFLRGYQVTDAKGLASFTTIYPGWYQGRTVHIHFKIRSDAGAASGLEFTSQLFFDDAVTDQVHATAPYAQKGQRTLRNDGDGIFGNGGSQLLLQLADTLLTTAK